MKISHSKPRPQLTPGWPYPKKQHGAWGWMGSPGSPQGEGQSHCFSAPSPPTFLCLRNSDKTIKEVALKGKKSFRAGRAAKKWRKAFHLPRPGWKRRWDDGLNTPKSPRPPLSRPTWRPCGSQGRLRGIRKQQGLSPALRPNECDSVDNLYS